MEQLALFVLPRTDNEEGEDFNSNDIGSDAHSSFAKLMTDLDTVSSVVELPLEEGSLDNVPLLFDSEAMDPSSASVCHCHTCGNQWYYQGGSTQCPQCKGDSTEIVSRRLCFYFSFVHLNM